MEGSYDGALCTSNKTGKLYQIVSMGINTTNNANDEDMVHYKPLYSCEYENFYRELKEFDAKFTLIG